MVIRTLVAVACALSLSTDAAADWKHVVQACRNATGQGQPPARLSLAALNLQGSATISKWDRRYPWEDCVIKILGARPVGPSFGSLAPGGGLAGGLRAERAINSGRVQSLAVVDGLMSLNGSLRVEARYDVMMPSFGQWNPATAGFEDQIIISPFARLTDLRDMPFYGLGDSTGKGTRTAYREKRVEGGVVAGVPLASWLTAGGGLIYLSPSISRTTTGNPALQDAYSPSDVPGLQAQPAFLDEQVFIRLHTPTNTAQTWNRHEVRLTHDFFHNQDNGADSVRRIQLFALGSYELRRNDPNVFHRSWLRNFLCQSIVGDQCRLGNLVVDFLVSGASSDSRVPFYLQDTLGGTDRQGFDTLAGVDGMRLRAPHRALVQAEFYKDVTGWFGMYAFYERGTVALGRADLGSRWHHDYGPGLFVRAGGRIVLKVFAAYGGDAGTRYDFRFFSGL